MVTDVLVEAKVGAAIALNAMFAAVADAAVELSVNIGPERPMYAPSKVGAADFAPLTSSKAAGAEVPMPTFPVFLMVTIVPIDESKRISFATVADPKEIRLVPLCYPISQLPFERIAFPCAILIDPATSRLAVGALIPIPTFPCTRSPLLGALVTPA